MLELEHKKNMVRTKRFLGEIDRHELLTALATCRASLVQVLAKAPIYGDEYRAVAFLMRQIDDVVEAATGNRELLWARAPGRRW